MKYLKYIIFAFLISCVTTSTTKYGIVGIDPASKIYVDGEYHIEFVIHVTKNIDRIRTDYYYLEDGEWIYSGYTSDFNVKRSHQKTAKDNLGFLEEIAISDDVPIKAVIRAYHGEGDYSSTVVKEHIIE